MAKRRILWTAEGWLYEAVVLDLYSRRIVGWSVQAQMSAQWVTDALMMAIWRRGQPEAVMHHSDRGSQYTSDQFQRLSLELGVTCSMSGSTIVSDATQRSTTLALRSSNNGWN